MSYAKRYVGGFVDKPTTTTPIDATFLNAVEAALLKLFDTDPTVDGQVMQWINAQTKYGPALLLNKNIDPAAAISKTKIDLTGGNGIVDADISGVASISRSKLNFGSGLVNGDIAAAAAIAASKLAGYPTDGSKALLGDGSWGRQIFKKTTVTQVVNTTTPTDLLAGAFTIPILTSTSIVRMDFWGDMLNATGIAQNSPGWTLQLGGTTIALLGSIASVFNFNASRMPWRFSVVFNNDGATNANFTVGNFLSTFAVSGSGASSNGPTGGYMYAPGSLGGVTGAVGQTFGNTAIDTSTAKSLTLLVTNAVASASLDVRCRGALVEVL